MLVKGAPGTHMRALVLALGVLPAARGLTPERRSVWWTALDCTKGGGADDHPFVADAEAKSLLAQIPLPFTAGSVAAFRTHLPHQKSSPLELMNQSYANRRQQFCAHVRNGSIANLIAQSVRAGVVVGSLGVDFSPWLSTWDKPQMTLSSIQSTPAFRTICSAYLGAVNERGEQVIPGVAKARMSLFAARTLLTDLRSQVPRRPQLVRIATDLAASAMYGGLARDGFALVSHWAPLDMEEVSRIGMEALDKAERLKRAESHGALPPFVTAKAPGMHKLLAPLLTNTSLKLAVDTYLGVSSTQPACSYGYTLLRLNEGLSPDNYISSLWHHDRAGRRCARRGAIDLRAMRACASELPRRALRRRQVPQMCPPAAPTRAQRALARTHAHAQAQALHLPARRGRRGGAADGDRGRHAPVRVVQCEQLHRLSLQRVLGRVHVPDSSDGGPARRRLPLRHQHAARGLARGQPTALDDRHRDRPAIAVLALHQGRQEGRPPLRRHPVPQPGLLTRRALLWWHEAVQDHVSPSSGHAGGQAVAREPCRAAIGELSREPDMRWPAVDVVHTNWNHMWY
jgi:hypothetical protein